MNITIQEMGASAPAARGEAVIAAISPILKAVSSINAVRDNVRWNDTKLKDLREMRVAAMSLVCAVDDARYALGLASPRAPRRKV